MFDFNNLFYSSVVDQQTVNVYPDELKIKIFSLLPIKNLAILRLVSTICRTFIDTYFKEFSDHQFVFMLQKCQIENQHSRNFLSQFAIGRIVAGDFAKAFELAENMRGGFKLEESLADLVKNADSKEKIIQLMDLFLKKHGQVCFSFLTTIKPLLKRYFAILASLKKEKQEDIADNFKEALIFLKRYQWCDQGIHILMGLYIVETYPERDENQQTAIFDSLRLNNNCFSYVETRRMVEEFSFSTFLNFLVIAKVFPKQVWVMSFVLERITTREDALVFLNIGGTNVRKFIKNEEIYQRLNFFDLLKGASLLLEESETYQFYRKILKRADSAGEFEIGLQKLLERKPKEEDLEHNFRSIVSQIVEEASADHLSFGVYELLLHFPGSDSFAKAFLRIASICEKRLRKTIMDRVKTMHELNDDIRSELMALEIEMGEFNAALQTFCSITDPMTKCKAAVRFSLSIEKEKRDYLDIFIKELHDFLVQESSDGTPVLRELIELLAKEDVNRTLKFVKSKWTGYQLASCLTIIAKEQKNKKADFLPIVFEARSLITSLVSSSEDASGGLLLLKKLLELQ